MSARRYEVELVDEPVGGCECRVVHACHFCAAVEVPTSSETFGEPVCESCTKASR